MKHIQAPIEKLRELFSYDPLTGHLIAKTHNSLRPVGSVAGFKRKDGYIEVKVGNTIYRAHRIAWALAHGEWPDADIDHINGDQSDNRLVNLRKATRTQNNANTGVSKRNTSGFKGVDFHKVYGAWRARVKINKKSIHLGYFDTPEEAALAYKAGAEKHFGAFAKAATKDEGKA